MQLQTPKLENGDKVATDFSCPISFTSLAFFLSVK